MIERLMNRVRAGLATLACFLIPALPAQVTGQRLSQQITALGGRYQLERPVAMCLSPGGETIGLSDQAANRIYTIDLEGRLLDVYGDQNRLEQPQAVCLLSEDSLLFSQVKDQKVFRVTRQRLDVIDTVTDLTGVIDPKATLDAIVVLENGTFLVLNKGQGNILQFNKDWKYVGVLISNGSGPGKILVPTSITPLLGRKILVTDEKNYPVQVFSESGEFLFYGGRTNPGIDRGWEAVASAVDNTEIMWVADYTGRKFRLFDQVGSELSQFPFSDQLFRPAAMVGTPDNQVVVLDEGGSLVLYSLE